ncbi:tail fiber protein [Escherichia coli]|uniref:Short-chain fatty acid transporter n=15 Tax=Escherichia coli TaxID=562 RepID=A0A1M2EUC0_ECOLX|nr:tail fiber protein [Escherichia coli]EFN7272271.1 short-chain fatty acid transporter [Escherichia coli O21]EFA7744383.1 short-chain fatty acid transporter [Escherichia coli]EFB2598767.1 short-chain fatty acid transporter [Escherichia coli]EFB6353403.1 short-chain fatty acid transporter [Escherichia coli]EFB6610339.1 short-chain fatty acid transporter [Escherichia coli]
MSTRKFRTLITDIGLAKLAATTAPGGRPVRLTHMAVGDGNGELRQPQKNQTSLYNEVWRQSVNRVFTDPENPNRLIAELVIPPETGGFWVREIGVFDDTGTMIAVGNTAESYKPTREEGSGRAQIFRAVITVTSDAVVELVMDTTTILPTTDYIDEKMAEHARSRNHPDATLTEKGFTQLSSATNSTSETLAATPKAVKAAYDLAAGKAPASHTHPWNQITGVPSASLTAKGTVQLSSATNSESETEAATPKAVKALHDMVTSKYTGQDATTGRKGIVQLSSATNSNSETLAATPKAVSDALSMAFVKPTTSLGETDLNTLGRKEDAGDYYQQSDSGARTDRNYPVEKAGELRIRVGAWGFCQHEYTSWDPPRKFIRTVTGNFNGNGPWSEWVEVTNTDATTGRKGIVQLSSDTNSNSETLAATPRAVKAAYDLAAGKAPASHTHPWNQITGVPSASLTAKGTVQLSSATNSESETEAATPKAVKALHDMLTSKYTGQDATTGRKGIVQLSSATNSNSETLAATPKAVKAAYDLANSKASAAHTHRWAQITDAPVFSSVARVIMGKQSIKDILDYFGLGEGSTLPVGVPVPWPSSRPPEGWLQCNGAAFTRTKYPKLAVAYPDLRLPDLRGEFIRGWDDLRMIDRGRLLLSTQEATYICTAIQAYHGVAGGADIQAGISFASHDNDIINITPDQPRTGNGILYGTKPVDRWAIARAGKLVSNEKDRWIAIRPRNIAFNYIVRAV